MNIVQLLDNVGHTKLSFQWLHECVTNARAVGRGTGRERLRVSAATSVTFQTEAMQPADLIRTPKNVGLIIWIPRADFERVQAEVRAEKEKKAEPERHICEAVQHSDQVVCERCDQCWDAGDSNPPGCKPLARGLRSPIGPTADELDEHEK